MKDEGGIDDGEVNGEKGGSGGGEELMGSRC